MISEEYIKMILALPEEFFDGWDWKEGDMFLYKESDSEEFSIGYIGTHILERNKPISWMDVVYDPYETLRGLRPIPSQEQLQKMMGMSPIDFIEDFYEYAQEPIGEDMNPSIFYIDLNCFTLAYVMDRKFKKYWNGAAWIPLKNTY